MLVSSQVSLSFDMTHNLQKIVTPFTLYLNVENAQNPAQKRFEKTQTVWLLLMPCLTYQHLEHDDSKRPPVTGRIVPCLHENLRSNIIGGTHCRICLQGWKKDNKYAYGITRMLEFISGNLVEFVPMSEKKSLRSSSVNNFSKN